MAQKTSGAVLLMFAYGVDSSLAHSVTAQCHGVSFRFVEAWITDIL